LRSRSLASHGCGRGRGRMRRASQKEAELMPSGYTSVRPAVAMTRIRTFFRLADGQPAQSAAGVVQKGRRRPSAARSFRLALPPWTRRGKPQSGDGTDFVQKYQHPRILPHLQCLAIPSCMHACPLGTECGQSSQIDVMWET
jgi:hypothetical protein